MSTFEKRAREEKRDEKQREKERRRRDKKNVPRRDPQLTTAAEIVGNMRSIDEVMQGLLSNVKEQRGAATIPSKLFVGSLSDVTTNAGLRAHFQTQGEILEAVVITDRGTGATRNFGFVTLADRRNAPTAIDALHGSELDGNRIVVRVATDR
jgi:hypothetical protein